MSKLVSVLSVSVFFTSMCFYVAVANATEAQVIADYKRAIEYCKMKPTAEQKDCLRNAKIARDSAIKSEKTAREKRLIEPNPAKNIARQDASVIQKNAVNKVPATQEKSTKKIAKQEKATQEKAKQDKATKEQATKDKITKENTKTIEKTVK